MELYEMRTHIGLLLAVALLSCLYCICKRRGSASYPTGTCETDPKYLTDVTSPCFWAAGE